ncbi:MAG: (Fe-S)-binding protein, partial [Chlamydiia bacterium]|nr:(Fe-S)-binding protein [Chlamydiia bacterium]
MDASLEAVEHELSRCSDCGLCNAVCTTFQATQWESEGPRGRIALARDLQKGRSSPATQSLSTYDRCLSCGLCDAVCPSQVRFS